MVRFVLPVLVSATDTVLLLPIWTLPKLRPEFVRGIVEAAHKHGLRVSGHVPQGMVASQMVEDGAR
jgi:hypothetical protein